MLINLDINKFEVLLENVFPFLLIHAREGLTPDQLDGHPSISYFNFLNAEANCRLDTKNFPTQNMKLMFSELNLLRGGHHGGGAQKQDLFELCHDMIMVFRRQLWAYLAPTVFCFKVIDVKNRPNYGISDIFDRELFRTIGRQLTIFEFDNFCDLFLETGMIIRFLDKSFQILNQKHRLNKPIRDKQQPLAQVLKTLVNAFEVMPTGKLNSKTFFKFESKMVYSSISLREEETKRFTVAINAKVAINVDMEEIFDFYFAWESERKTLDLFSVSHLSGTSESILDKTIKSLKSLKSLHDKPIGDGSPDFKARVGADYFRKFQEVSLVNLNDKEEYDIENDFDQATDIF